MEFLNQLDMNNSKVTEVATPTLGTDAANKDYVDPKLALKAPLASPTFTGTVTAPTVIGNLTGTATKATGIIGSDTRYSNYAPSSYMGEGAGMNLDNTFSRGEFKSISTMGLSSYFTGSFCYVMTHVPWSDISGGVPVQIAYGSGTPCYRVATGTATWGAWVQINDGGNADTLDGLEASAFSLSSHTHTKSQITDFPTLATVATSGSYNDLSNKPTIPTLPSIATQAQAEAGTDNTTMMTPQTTAQAIAASNSASVVLAYW